MTHVKLLAVLVVPVVLLAGCSRPQVEPEHRVLIKALRSAVNTRNPQWLEEAAERVEVCRTEGSMGDAAYAEFQSILADARAGRWEDAEAEVVKLAKAQRPTPAEIERLNDPARSRRAHQH